MIRNDYKNTEITAELLLALLDHPQNSVTIDDLVHYSGVDKRRISKVLDALRQTCLISKEPDLGGAFEINKKMIAKRDLQLEECVRYAEILSSAAVVFLVALYKIQRPKTAYEKDMPSALVELLDNELVYLFDDYYCSYLSLNTTEEILKNHSERGDSQNQQFILKHFQKVISEWQKFDK